ncbi:hypothetical protein, partial [Klebsiella sp. S69]|uniref:hypothetical protein n=1 Tax=Klebsiella sp. S69 TaxID=2767439 RepID=UPI001D129643
EGQLMEMEATGAPQKHHNTLNQQVGSITLVLLLFILTGIALPLRHTSTQFISPSQGETEAK